MRFVDCCCVTLVITSITPARGVAAQSERAAPAGVTRHAEAAGPLRLSPDSGRTSVRTHMVRGAVVGGSAGLILSALAVASVANQTCETVTSLPGSGSGGGCENSNLGKGKGWSIVFGGIGVGAAVGALLGYEYHENLEDQRKARCRANPSACA